MSVAQQKKTRSKKTKKPVPKKQSAFLKIVLAPFKKLWTRRKNFLARRPHRSFRITRRRDYKRSLKLPGYWSFTNQVRRLLASHRWLFTKFIIIYSLASGLILGVMSQDNYKLLSSTIHSIGNNALQGQLGGVGQSLVISAGVIGGAFNGQLSQAQQVYGGLLFLLGWLSLIWLLRQVLAGHKKTKLRDGLYSSGSPLIASFVIFLIVLLQTIPLAIAITAYATAATLDVLGNLLFSSLFWTAELLLALLSLYWLSNSIIAFVVVTLPGMYPIKALKAASDLVVGRRLRLLYRLSWLLLSIVVFWLVVLTLSVLIANIGLLQNLPIVPIVVLLLFSITLVWTAAYIYLLYRKLVDDGSAPA